MEKHSAEFLTEQAIIFQTYRFGYDPTVNNPRTFPDLYDDLCNNQQFCLWLRDLVPENILGQNDTTLPYFNSQQQTKIHQWMGENTPVWARRWHILLSAIVPGLWDKWRILYNQQVC